MSELLRTTYTENSVDVAKVAEIFSAHNSFAILIHRHPDGDAVCSALGLALILEKLGKEARICCADPIPDYLAPLCDRELHTDGVFSLDETLIAVDVAEQFLLGAVADTALEKGIALKLDHHRTGSDFAACNMTDPDASAAGEIVYRLAKHYGMEDDAILLACYGAIAADTGGFRYANATAGAFAAAAEMRARGISFEETNSALFESRDYRTLAATAYGVGKTTFHFDGQAALFAISREEMEQNGFTDDNMTELPSMLREIKGVHISLVMREEKRLGSYRLSTRSDRFADCTALCGAFGGGGHLRAAGASIVADSKEAAIEVVLAELQKQFEV